MEKEKREHDPIKGTFPDAKKIMCKDCFYRDRATVKIGDSIKYPGITRDFCAKYPEPPASNGKPTGVLFYGEKCPEYLKDKNA